MTASVASERARITTQCIMKWSMMRGQSKQRKKQKEGSKSWLDKDTVVGECIFGTDRELTNHKNHAERSSTFIIGLREITHYMSC